MTGAARDTLAEVLEPFNRLAFMRNAWACEVAMACRKGLSLNEACRSLAAGALAPSGIFVPANGYVPSEDTLRRYFRHYRSRAIQTGTTDLRVQIIAALGLDPATIVDPITVHDLIATTARNDNPKI